MSEKRRIFGGGTYETRNKTYEMDPEMFSLLKEFGMESEQKLVTGFQEGLACGRIYEVDAKLDLDIERDEQMQADRDAKYEEVERDQADRAFEENHPPRPRG